MTTEIELSGIAHWEVLGLGSIWRLDLLFEICLLAPFPREPLFPFGASYRVLARSEHPGIHILQNATVPRSSLDLLVMVGEVGISGLFPFSSQHLLAPDVKT